MVMLKKGNETRGSSQMDFVIGQVCYIVHHSLDNGDVPEVGKRANIVPVYKKGYKEDPLNYKPVSLTSVLCKLWKRVIKK